MRLKGSVYVMTEPDSGAFIALRGERPRVVAEIHLATLAPAGRPECVAELIALSSEKLASRGVPHELVRVDA